MAVTTPGCKERESIFGRITDLIYQQVFIGTCTSMDMLQGIMVFISWTTYSKKPFLNFYCHVVMGIVCDMGINKAVPKDLSTMQAFKYAVGWRQNNVPTRTLDERRAVLGCFLISSGVALAMSRIDALRWNPYMDECLAVLTDTKECPEDEILVNLVRIQLVMDKVYHARRDGEDQFQARIYIKSFEGQLDAIRKQIPLHLQRDELVIHDWAIQTPIYPYSPELQRLESLYTALQATKNWLDVWLSFSPDFYQGLPFTLFFQFARNIVSLYRLSTLEDPGWDRNMVRSTANILDIIERIIYNMKKCANMVAEANPALREFDKGIFDKGMKMMASIKLGWEPKLMEIWYPSLPPSGLNGDEFVAPATDLSNMIPFGLDDVWMMEVFGSL
ncbi:hypothetical protein N7478_004351 [Penicillium angulare]|uniref:uncharacterized protein n=1 Tax=Penicillium angulare TaxID=116970 RepID=UPI00253FA2AB|nr:uncharacterized protein N7478_004351 [Penicillium angulare]KAJ5278979.1 hypothetical protein N7478_004351 [Penicillium angulare]